jgi:hypothetical protein
MEAADEEDLVLQWPTRAAMSGLSRSFLRRKEIVLQAWGVSGGSKPPVEPLCSRC